MKHYLDLAGISAKVRRRQSRMTRLCIMLAVFLVSAIFGMADMWLNCQRIEAVSQYGSWHAAVKGGISQEDGALIAARPEVVRAAWYCGTNTTLGDAFTIGGQPVALCGYDAAWEAMFPSLRWLEGGYPSETGTIGMTANARTLLGVRSGDTVTLDSPSGAIPLRVAGFIGDTGLMSERDGVGLVFNSEDYRRYFSGIPEAEMWFYIELTPYCRIQRVLDEIQSQFGLAGDQLGQNPKLVALLGQSDNPFMKMLYAAAAILSALVSVSGVLMLAGSMNSSVAQRTAFFGLLRCLGATPGQVRKFVRREALLWCRSAIPVGLSAGTAVCWALCEMLRFLAPTYFADMPRLGVSPAALFSGAAVGVLTVLLAARAPARRASAVSPLTAVSGNAGTVRAARKAANTRFFRVEAALGIHHAVGSRRGFLLMAGSFAFSILLFLSFSVVVDFMHHAVKPVRPSAPDFSVISPDDTCPVPFRLAEEIAALPAVKRVYGRSLAQGLEGECGGEPVRINLISYEAHQFRWAGQARLDGDISEAEAGNGLLSAYSTDSVLNTGDFLQINGYALPVAGRLSYSPFDMEPGTETLFCSEALFRRLAGGHGYTVLDVQFLPGAGDDAAAEIRALAGERFGFSDRRISNRDARGAYYSFALFVYGFLALIAMITVFHIVNSMGLSVSARMKQYGAMRAVGMSTRQLTRMVAAEAVAYALSGALLGCALGLPLHWLLFRQMVSFQWGDLWSVPWQAMLVIVMVMLAATALSVAAPARRIREMSVTDTISAE